MSIEKLTFYILKRIKELKELEQIYLNQGKREEVIGRRNARWELEDLIEIITSGVMD